MSSSVIQIFTGDYSIGDNSEKLFQRGRRGASIYRKWIFFFFLLGNACSQAYIVRNDYYYHEEQISQVYDFSDILGTEKCKNLGSLPFFLRHTSNFLGIHFFKAQGSLLVSDCSGWRLNPCITGWWTTLFVSVVRRGVGCRWGGWRLLKTAFNLVQSGLHFW